MIVENSYKYWPIHNYARNPRHHYNIIPAPRDNLPVAVICSKVYNTCPPIIHKHTMDISILYNFISAVIIITFSNISILYYRV